MDLFHCDRLRADLTAKGCVNNQGRGQREGKISLYGPCVECDMGRVIREASGLAVPEIGRNGAGGLGVIDRKPPSKVEVKVLKPCKNHKNREALPGDNMCRECKQAYQREWYARKKAKQTGEDMPEKLAVVETEKMQAEETKLCVTCHAEPQHKKSNRCKKCLTETLNRPEVKAKRLEGIGKLSRRAHAALSRLEAGELVETVARFDGIFNLVEGLKDKIQDRAAVNLRSLEAEMAVLLREAVREKA